MRVLMTSDAVGGVWQYSFALIRGLVEQHGCQVMLVCVGSAPEESLGEIASGPGVEVVVLPRRLEWMPHSEGDVRLSLREAERLAALWKPDIIHSNQYCFGLLDSASPVVVVAHSDVLSWHAWLRCRTGRDSFDLAAASDFARRDPFLRRYSDLVSSGLAAASAVVSPSGFVASSLERIYGIRSSVIYNGLWTDGYCSSAKEAIALVAGRLWDEAKNAALGVIACDGLPLSLLLAGPRRGPCGEETELPAAENARYLGRCSTVTIRDVMSRASVYLATSTYEPFGLATLEAALSGCALVANDTPSNRELWDGAAQFHRFNDASDLQRVLLQLLEQPELVSSWGEAARQHALSRFAAERMTGEYVELYLRLSGRGSGNR